MKAKTIFAYAIALPWFPFYGIGYLANFLICPPVAWFSEGWNKAERHMEDV